MDRVLLIIDDIQYAGHLENTLRKVGFDIETITNEFHMPEKLLSFNPDYIIVKGMGVRVSTEAVGKKLKESTKFLGKVILVFPQDRKTSNPEELIKLRMDVLLFEPISALRLANSLLSLTQLDKDTIFDRLMRLALTDPQFRAAESELLQGSGSTIESEIKLVTGRAQQGGAVEGDSSLKEDDILNFISPQGAESKKSAAEAPDLGLSPEYKQAIQNELNALDNELSLRIETYNNAIKTIDQDLKSGHKKRQTRSVNVKLFSEIPEDGRLELDEERKKFAKALVKKN
jgi:hypothetical protein